MQTIGKTTRKNIAGHKVTIYPVVTVASAVISAVDVSLADGTRPHHSLYRVRIETGFSISTLAVLHAFSRGRTMKYRHRLEQGQRCEPSTLVLRLLPNNPFCGTAADITSHMLAASVQTIFLSPQVAVHVNRSLYQIPRASTHALNSSSHVHRRSLTHRRPQLRITPSGICS